MTTVEQQGEPKRRREHPEAPQAAHSSSSSSSESSTDTEMGLVDVCTILRKNSEAKGRCEGGPATLDLTKWDFNKELTVETNALNWLRTRHRCC